MRLLPAMLHDVLGDKAPIFVLAPCWVRYGTTVYAYNVLERCVGVMLRSSKEGNLHVPDEQFERLEPAVSKRDVFLALSHTIDHALPSLWYEYMCTWKILGYAQKQQGQRRGPQ
jgi:hypothetical protein